MLHIKMIFNWVMISSCSIWRGAVTISLLCANSYFQLKTIDNCGSFSLSRFSKKFKSLSTSEERPGSSCFTRLKSALARSISHMKPNALPLLRIENQIVSLWMSPVPRLRETCASATRKGKNCGSQRFHVSIHQHWMLHCLICANKVIWDGLAISPP